jgi:hypothetical protein
MLAFVVSVGGAILAIVCCMDNKGSGTDRNGRVPSWTRVVRGFAEGSLVAWGFAGAIVLLGTTLALLVRGLHAGLSWFVRLGGDTSALMDGLVSVSSVVGGLVLVVVFARLLFSLSDWRRRFRARVSNRHVRSIPVNRRRIAGAA